MSQAAILNITIYYDETKWVFTYGHNVWRAYEMFDPCIDDNSTTTTSTVSNNNTNTTTIIMNRMKTLTKSIMIIINE